MSELSERLRKPMENRMQMIFALRDAADEIDHLEAELARLQQELIDVKAILTNPMIVVERADG